MDRRRRREDGKQQDTKEGTAINHGLPEAESVLFTLGLADHAPDRLRNLLRGNGIEVVMDARAPSLWDETLPETNTTLEGFTATNDLEYKTFGEPLPEKTPPDAQANGLHELGGAYAVGGTMPCLQVTNSSAFLTGIDRLVRGTRDYRIAVVCQEEDPAACRRRLLVGRAAATHGVRVRHIRADGRLQAEEDLRRDDEIGAQSRVDPLLLPVYSIGVTSHTASQFFGIIRNTGIRRLLDVRLNNWTQLAGFTKRDDLPFFLRELCDAEYVHEPLLAPTRVLLDAYKKGQGTWQEYEKAFLGLMAEREVEKQIDSRFFEVPTVLLCYEPEADFCHRRLVLDYLQSKWGNLKITHL